MQEDFDSFDETLSDQRVSPHQRSVGGGWGSG